MTGVPALAAMDPSPALVDLPRQDCGEFVGEPLQPLRLLVNLGRELVIENGRRYGGDKADCGRKKCLGDTWCNDSQGRVLGGGDRLEAGHNAPDRPEQPYKRTSRAN